MSKDYSLRVETKVWDKKSIETSVISSVTLSSRNTEEALFRRVLDLQEVQVREALISLGWTPPSPPSPPSSPDTQWKYCCKSCGAKYTTLLSVCPCGSREFQTNRNWKLQHWEPQHCLRNF